jgi:hypothetical protein
MPISCKFIIFYIQEWEESRLSIETMIFIPRPFSVSLTRRIRPYSQRLELATAPGRKLERPSKSRFYTDMIMSRYVTPVLVA